MTRTTTAREVAARVVDPELPVVTIEDLGILRDVTEDDQGRVHVQVTPTYSGCPAMETIRTDLVCQRLQQLCAKTAGGGHLVHLNKKGLTFILTPLLTIVHERMIGGAMSEEQHPRTITSPDLALRPCRPIRTRKMGGDHSMPT